jgi:hypothetical protein
MVPLFLYTALSALLGFSVHKKWYGVVAFAGCMLVWLILMQLIMVYMLRASAPQFN